MPTYDYECRSCGHEFEAFQSMSADPLKECPQCGGDLRRLIGGGSGVLFKGSGFYINDSRKASSSSPSSSGTPSPSGATSSSGTSASKGSPSS